MAENNMLNGVLLNQRQRESLFRSLRNHGSRPSPDPAMANLHAAAAAKAGLYNVLDRQQYAVPIGPVPRPDRLYFECQETVGDMCSITVTAFARVNPLFWVGAYMGGQSIVPRADPDGAKPWTRYITPVGMDSFIGGWFTRAEAEGIYRKVQDLNRLPKDRPPWRIINLPG